MTPNSATARVSITAYKAFARSFCGDVDQNAVYSAIAQSSATTSPESDQLARLHAIKKEQLRSAETTQLVWDLIDTSNSPAVFATAADVAAMAATGRYAATNEILAGTRLENRIEGLRGEAAQHAFCIRTGACGPGTYFAAAQCREYAFCTPGIPLGYFDVLQRVYSPYELQLIEQWSALLLANRPPVR